MTTSTNLYISLRRTLAYFLSSHRSQTHFDLFGKRYLECSWAGGVCSYSSNDSIDWSKLPTFQEEDVEEQYIKGGGPGGQHVNKRVNCVRLRHIPTGVMVKCHHSRTLDENRKLARKMLISKLDSYYNGDMSIDRQMERLQTEKSIKRKRRSEMVSDMKANYKKILSSK